MAPFLEDGSGQKRSLQLCRAAGSIQHGAITLEEALGAVQRQRKLSQEIRPSARRFFVTTGYFPGTGGILEPAMPTTCPQASPRGKRCDVRPHFLRPRKTGPRFPLTVARCHIHDCSFTLYPPAFGPYLRAPVLHLAPDGTAPLSETRDRQGLEAFEGTLFQAAIDGERRKAWARDSLDGVPDRWWSTQGRRIGLAMRLLGIARDIDARLRERIASVLSLDHLFLRDQSRAEKDGYHARASAVCAVLRRLTQSATAALRLLFVGRLIGHWGAPRHWDQRRQVLARLPFRIPPIRAPA